MFDDFRMPRELGILGSVLLLLVGMSSLVSIKSWIETPFNRAQADQVEKTLNWDVLGPGAKAKHEAETQRIIAQANAHMNIDFPGTILWCIAGFLIFFKSLWGTRAIWAGAIFKIWANSLGGVNVLVFFDVTVLLMALLLHARWKKETPCTI